MLRSMLLVIDGQEIEHASIGLGIRWSLEFDAILAGLGVIDEVLVRPVEAVPLGAARFKLDRDDVRLRERQAAIGSALSAIAVRCAQSRAGFKPLECIGQAADEIAVEAQRFDLILMPRQLREQDEGSTSNTNSTLIFVLRASPRPVVAAADSAPAGNSVVVAYDGSLQAARTLYSFVATGLADKCSIHVVSVDETPLVAAKTGNRAVEYLDSHGIRATLSADSSDDVAERIMNVARDVSAGLIVLGAYGQPRYREFLLGSVTSTMLNTCAIPLFLFH